MRPLRGCDRHAKQHREGGDYVLLSLVLISEPNWFPVSFRLRQVGWWGEMASILKGSANCLCASVYNGSLPLWQ